MSVMDVSSKLGEYMLKGWVLTDEACPSEGCSVPLLRSPRSQPFTTFFCVNCNEQPDNVKDMDKNINISLSPDNALQSPLSLSKIPIEPSGSDFDNEQGFRRRHQSDIAAAEIGKCLLKGWTMLADECPNSGCYGIPLVRPPAKTQSKKSKKECVICRTIYAEQDKASDEKNTLIPVPQKKDQGKIYQNKQLNNRPTCKSDTIDEVDSEGTTTLDALHKESTVAVTEYTNLPSESHGLLTLNSTREALEFALSSLSSRLVATTTDQNLMDLISIGQTVDTIGKIVRVLEELKRVGSSGVTD